MVRLEGAVTIPATSTVTVQPGTVMLTDGSNLTVEGTLLAQGTANAPIIVTSSLPSPHAGVGGAIFIDGPRAGGTRLDYVHDFYSLGSGVSVTGGAQPVISNSAFIASTEQGIYIDDTSAPTIANCVFASNGEYAVSSPRKRIGINYRNSPRCRSTWHIGARRHHEPCDDLAQSERSVYPFLRDGGGRHNAERRAGSGGRDGQAGVLGLNLDYPGSADRPWHCRGADHLYQRGSAASAGRLALHRVHG